jgi:hypothetical protein
LAAAAASATAAAATSNGNDKNGRSLTTQQNRKRADPHNGASVDDVIMHIQLLHQYQLEQEHDRHKVQCERHLQPPPHRRIGEETLPSIEDQNALLHQWQEPLIAQSFFSPLLNHRHRQSKHQNKSTTPTSATTTTSTTSIPQSMEEMNRKYNIDYKTVLGEGAYGIVHPAHIITQQQHQDQGDNMVSVEAADAEGGRTGVALKIISKSKMLKSSTSTSEIDALLRIFDCGGHPNISGLRDIYARDYWREVMQYHISILQQFFLRYNRGYGYVHTGMRAEDVCTALVTLFRDRVMEVKYSVSKLSSL